MTLESIISCTAPRPSWRSCRPMPASLFMTVPAAGRGCGQNQAIVACFAPTGRSRARRSKPSVHEGPVQLIVAEDKWIAFIHPRSD